MIISIIIITHRKKTKSKKLSHFYNKISKMSEDEAIVFMKNLTDYWNKHDITNIRVP